MNLKLWLVFFAINVIGVAVDLATVICVHNLATVFTVIAVTIPACCVTTLYLGQLSVISETMRMMKRLADTEKFARILEDSSLGSDKSRQAQSVGARVLMELGLDNHTVAGFDESRQARLARWRKR